MTNEFDSPASPTKKSGGRLKRSETLSRTRSFKNLQSFQMAAAREKVSDIANAELVKKAGGPKKKDKTIEKEANLLIFKFLWEQKGKILLGMPFMLLGSLTDFLFPNFIG